MLYQDSGYICKKLEPYINTTPGSQKSSIKDPGYYKQNEADLDVLFLLVNMIFPVVWRQRSVGDGPSEQDVTFALVHHAAGFVVVVERHGCGSDCLNIDGHLRLPESTCAPCMTLVRLDCFYTLFNAII